MVTYFSGDDMKIDRVVVWGGYRDVMGFGWMKLGGKVMMRARNDGQSRSRDGRCVSISHVHSMIADRVCSTFHSDNHNTPFSTLTALLESKL